MKYHLYSLATVLVLATAPASDAALAKNQVASDAKWLLHLDLQNLRRTQVGEFLTKHVVEKATGELKAKAGIDLGALVSKISHVTAYGTDFAKHPEANGVMMIQMDAEAQKILEGFLAAQLLADAKGALKKEQKESSVLYSLKNELFLAVQPDHLVMLGKSQRQIEKAQDVIAGTAANLNESRAFSDFPAVPEAFFFLAVAEGFNEDSAIPPQAQVLKMADGGRLVLGEKAERLFLDLALRAKSSEVSDQIQQVFEGIKAMVSLSQDKNQELQELVRSIKVSTKGKIVTINVEYPVGPLMKKVGEKIDDKFKGRDGESTSKPGSEPKADGAENPRKKAE
ncbi:MAG: hypothetical protein HY735_04080 [Verrucomicrobia bacterium]|nr:hypothetical protein [Verrucomicrobiota bacterium]